MDRSIQVIGHKHPDTDSICSAIAYAKLKNALDPDHRYEPCRAGLVNRETQFVLDYFGVPAPRLCADVSPQLQDADYRHEPGVPPELSLKRAWYTLRDRKVDTLCVVDDEGHLLGLVTIRDMAKVNMDLIDEHILARTGASYQNVAETLDAQVAAGELAGRRVEGRIVIASGSAETMADTISKGDVVILANRADSQLAAIEMEAGCIVVCGGATVSETICSLARSRGCIVLTTAHSTYAAGQMIVQASPVRAYMVSDDLITFTPHTLVETVTKIMATVRYRYFPVVDDDNRCVGLISRRNLLNLKKKQLILVDHNEKSQAVDGLEESEVLEIVDHHRIGTLETDAPVYFRNVPVGSTCTIVYQLYEEHGVTPDKATAGLLLSAILSDTLMFRSPTCTPVDERAAQALAALAGVDMESYAASMFDRGGDVSGKSPEDILRTDYKLFNSGDRRFGVGHGSFMTEKNRLAAQALLGPYLPTALARQGLDYIFYMFTDIPTSTTQLMMAGKGAEDLARRAFGAEIQSDGTALLPGVVSRKKQVIPALMGAIKQQLPESF